MTKKLLIASFVYKKNIKEFLPYIEKEFKIDPKKVFIFENLNDDTQFITTFYIEIPIGERINLKDYFRNALIVHKKKDTFYTINALNKLIERDYNLEKGNIDYKRWAIDWNAYRDKLIVNSNNNLVLIGLKRFFC